MEKQLYINQLALLNHKFTKKGKPKDGFRPLSRDFCRAGELFKQKNPLNENSKWLVPVKIFEITLYPQALVGLADNQ